MFRMRLKVESSDAFATAERYVSAKAVDRQIAMRLHRGDVEGAGPASIGDGWIAVGVVEKTATQALVLLPVAPFVGPMTLWFPIDQLAEYR